MPYLQLPPAAREPSRRYGYAWRPRIHGALAERSPACTPGLAAGPAAEPARAIRIGNARVLIVCIWSDSSVGMAFSSESGDRREIRESRYHLCWGKEVVLRTWRRGVIFACRISLVIFPISACRKRLSVLPGVELISCRR